MLAKVIPHITLLTRLHITMNVDTTGWSSLTAALPALTNLRVLEVRVFVWEECAARWLVTAISALLSLTHLRLWGNVDKEHVLVKSLHRAAARAPLYAKVDIDSMRPVGWSVYST